MKNLRHAVVPLLNEIDSSSRLLKVQLWDTVREAKHGIFDPRWTSPTKENIASNQESLKLKITASLAHMGAVYF
jgi:hypothetical protein